MSPVEGPSPAPRLFVVWDVPPGLRDSDLVLSFLSPIDEEALVHRRTNRVESGRRLAEELRTHARDTFTAIHAGAGVVSDDDGRTLRAALRRRDGECSDWWFHSASSKALPPGDRTIFEWVATALAIDGWAAALGARTLYLHGAPRMLVAVLRSKYRVLATGSWSAPRLHAVRWRVDALFDRLACFRWLWRTTRRAPSPARLEPNGDRGIIALTGHEWLRWDEQKGAFVDTLYGNLAAALEQEGFRVLRLLWSLRTDHGTETPTVSSVPFRRGDAVALQTFVTRRDIITEMLSFRPVRVFGHWSRRENFRAVFRVGGLDLFELFRIPLAAGFWGGQIPLARVAATATARACDLHEPRATVCHFEWLHETRAHYEGVRRTRHGTLSTTMQHGSNTGMEFYDVDPAIEFRGEPDGCRPPHAGHVFVMGRVGFERFRACGYAVRDLSITGSTRYDLGALTEAVRFKRRGRAPRGVSAALRVLVVPSLLARDADLIEAAYVAAAGLANIEVYVRQKPDRSLKLRPSTVRLGSRLRFTDAELADDLAAADLVLFSASSVAEQALVCGVPTWQWLAVNLPGASLPEVVALRRFHSVAELRDALIAFTRNPSAFEPSLSDVARTVDAIFGHPDGFEAQRIAGRVRALVDGMPPRGAAPGAGTVRAWSEPAVTPASQGAST